MSAREMTDPVTAASIDRQLGEMVGTVRMTVTAMENLRLSVERLTERAAFKGDLEMVRAELSKELEAARTELKAELKSEKVKIDGLQKWMWLCMGGSTVLATVLRYVDFSKLFGG